MDRSLPSPLEVFKGANHLSGLATGCLDAHTHVFRRDLPMVAGRRYTPVADAPLAGLVRHLRTNRLAGALLVQPSFLGTDNQYLVQTLHGAAEVAPDLRFFGVAVVGAQAPQAELEQLNRDGIIGCRLNLVGREASFRLSDWTSTLARADAMNWHVEVHAAAGYLPDLIRQLAPIVRTVVVDHFGLPAGLPDALEMPSWVSGQRVERLMVKLSAPYRFLPVSDLSDAAAVAGRCRDLVTYLVSELGANNLMWGSDWPWTQFEGQINYDDAIVWRNAWATMAAG